MLGANDDGYGSIMLQRYWVTSNSEGAGAGNALVGLGRDGQVGGDNDAAAQFSVDDDAGVAVPVYGRAPQLTGLAQGQLAIGWVENDGAQETVKGAVIERDGGRAVLNIIFPSSWMCRPSSPRAPIRSSRRRRTATSSWVG